MEKIKFAFKQVFERFDEALFQPRMKLGDLPDWDSMASVNLQLELESAFGVALSGVFLTSELTLADVVGILTARGATAAAEAGELKQ